MWGGGPGGASGGGNGSCAKWGTGAGWTVYQLQETWEEVAQRRACLPASKLSQLGSWLCVYLCMCVSVHACVCREGVIFSLLVCAYFEELVDLLIA